VRGAKRELNSSFVLPTSPQAGRKGTLLPTDNVRIDPGRAKGRMAQPALNQVRWNKGLERRTLNV
jgi:hypothetical protein